MFTGIIEATAKLLTKTANTLTLERPKSFEDIKIGSSIAVSGVCLTVTEFDASFMRFDVVETTLQKTKLGSLAVGDRVNLERAMRADGRFEGHIVQGHVEGVGVIVALDKALSPNPSPVPVEGDAAERMEHVWKGLSDLRYPPTSVIANARAMRKEPTKAEELMWQRLRTRQIGGFYFRRQRPIGSCIVDFYCEELRLAIEIDGSIHDEEDQRAYDQWRSEHLGLRGVHILRFTNEQAMNHMDDVIASIELYCKSPLHPKGGGVGGGGTEQAGKILEIKLPINLQRYVVLHGSITIDGVALTVSGLSGNEISIALIPHTLEQTTLGSLKAGNSVNIETDILGRYILQAHEQK